MDSVLAYITLAADNVGLINNSIHHPRWLGLSFSFYIPYCLNFIYFLFSARVRKHDGTGHQEGLPYEQAESHEVGRDGVDQLLGAQRSAFGHYNAQITDVNV